MNASIFDSATLNNTCRELDPIFGAIWPKQDVLARGKSRIEIYSQPCAPAYVGKHLRFSSLERQTIVCCRPSVAARCEIVIACKYDCDDNDEAVTISVFPYYYICDACMNNLTRIH